MSNLVRRNSHAVPIPCGEFFLEQLLEGGRHPAGGADREERACEVPDSAEVVLLVVIRHEEADRADLHRAGRRVARHSGHRRAEPCSGHQRDFTLNENSPMANPTKPLASKPKSTMGLSCACN